MIKAGALFYSVVISVIIAFLTSSVILFSYFFRSEYEAMEIEQRLITNAQSGLQVLLAQKGNTGKAEILDLFGKECDSVELRSENWGLFNIGYCRSFSRNRERAITALFGNLPETNRICLYLADQDKPLAVCGTTHLKGTAFLPKAGIKRAYIEGQSFQGSEVVTGEIRISQRELPGLQLSTRDHIRKMFLTHSLGENDSIVTVAGELNIDTIENSFNNRTIVFSSDSDLSINTGVYKGNIAIISSGTITVASPVKIENLILAARKILLRSEVKSSLQAFATDSILLEKNVSLHYPSTLAILTEQGKNSAIFLSENDSVSGCVVLSKPFRQDDHSSILLKKDSFVHGLVYSSGMADIQGTIHGSVYCNSIVLKTPSSVYQNHLLNTVIDATALSEYYIGPLFDDRKKKGISCYLP